MDLAETEAEVKAIEAQIAALQEDLPFSSLAFSTPAGRGKRGTKRGRSVSKTDPRPVRTPKASSSVDSPTMSVKDKKKDLAEKIKQLERQIAKEAAETKMITESDPEERKMQIQIEALQRKLEETKQAKEKALKKAQKQVESYTPVPAKTPGKRGQKTVSTPAPVTEEVDESTRTYCYCKRHWDQSLAMIGCDACDEWYHLSCLGMFSSEAVCIDSYICVTCQHKKIKNKQKTRYKTEEAMAIEISEMPGELVAREIEVVMSELRELAGKEAEAIIAAIECPPPALEPVSSPTLSSEPLPSTDALAEEVPLDAAEADTSLPENGEDGSPDETPLAPEDHSDLQPELLSEEVVGEL